VPFARRLSKQSAARLTYPSAPILFRENLIWRRLYCLLRGTEGSKPAPTSLSKTSSDTNGTELEEATETTRDGHCTAPRVALYRNLRASAKIRAVDPMLAALFSSISADLYPSGQQEFLRLFWLV
jgi:hypothetical protein